jgi:hypothetical protein
MMIPHKSSDIWKLLVTGKRKCRCNLVPASILLERIIRSTQDDNSPENIQQCVEETYNFFVRYKLILTNKDIKQLFEEVNEPVRYNSNEH